MWMSLRIVPAFSSSTSSTCTAALARLTAPTTSPLTASLGCVRQPQRFLSTLARGSNALEPFQPKVPGMHWAARRHLYSTKAVSPSMTMTQFKSPIAKTTTTTHYWSRTWVATSAVSGSIFAPMLWARFNPGYKVAHCAAPANFAPERPSYPPTKEPLISPREITFGSVMGLGSGFLFKKLGKLILLVIGLGFVSLQLLSNQGYVTVHWSRFERRFKDSFDLDGDGKVTMNDAKHGFRALIDLLTKNFQFKSTFIGGFVLGFKYG